MFCPVAERSRNVPDHDVVRQDTDAYDELEPAQRAGFDEYFVVRTPATARRYRDHVVPCTTLVDEAALGRIFARWTVDVGSETFSAPTLIVAGRRDSTVGYSDATELFERYPARHPGSYGECRPRAHARAARTTRRARPRLARSDTPRRQVTVSPRLIRRYS
jgi:pimeloyl-ACP methyl ester carboxylesterase